MRNIQAVVFDMDDTLIPNAGYFVKVKNEIAAILFRQFEIFGYTLEQLHEVTSNANLKMVVKHGLSRNSFVMSAIDAYFELSKKHETIIDLDVITDLQFASTSVFDYIDELGPLEECFLRFLNSNNVPVYLLTSGDKVVQSYKIYSSNIYKHIPKDNIFIVDKKSPETYREILKNHEISKCVMIGNSKKSDINPSILADMYAIHIDIDTWGYEDEALKDSHKLFTVKNFSEVMNVFHEINK